MRTKYKHVLTTKVVQSRGGRTYNYAFRTKYYRLIKTYKWFLIGYFPHKSRRVEINFNDYFKAKKKVIYSNNL